MSWAAETAPRARLALCWVSNPAAPARCCTLRPGHDGDHYHEYSDASWPRKAADRR